jgi:hypothetical protein
MDKEGNVTAIFVKGAAPNGKLYAVRGRPGGSGQAVQWSALVRLDTDAIPFSHPGGSNTYDNMALAAAPNGNVHAVWVNRAPCGAGYTPPSTALCSYIYSSTYTANSDSWAAPILVSDFFSTRPIPMINDRGDVAVQFVWYNQVSPPKTGTADRRGAVAWRAAGQSTFQKRAFSDIYWGAASATVLGSTGRMVVASHKAQTNSTNKDIFTYVGDVGTGFAATEGFVIDNLNNDATLRDLAIGTTDDILLTWDQNDASGAKTFESSLPSASTTWSAPVAFAGRTVYGVGFMTDNGDAMFYDGCTAWERPKATGTWKVKSPAMPSNCGYSSSAGRSSDGSFLTYVGSSGLWNTYYQTNNAMAREAGAPPTASDYLLGFQRGWGNWQKVVYTKKADGNFVGAVLVTDEFDTLPTPTAPSGDGRNLINNLWGFYLK